MGVEEFRACKGCGYCCSKSVCVLGQMHFGVEPWDVPCKGLRWDDEAGRYYCRMVEWEKQNFKPIYGPGSIAFELSIGQGCCCPLNSDRRNVRRNHG